MDGSGGIDQVVLKGTEAAIEICLTRYLERVKHYIARTDNGYW